MKYATFIAPIAAFLAPKASIYLLIPVTAYLDMIKRTMVFDYSLSQLDLVYVLAFAPLIVAGLASGILLNAVLGKWKLTKLQWKCAIISIVLGGILTLLSVTGGVSLGALGKIANEATYVLMMFAMVVLFTERPERHRLAVITVLTYIPVAVYGVWQFHYGLSMFELAYLETGLSTESRQFGEHIFRVFSTLNSAGSLSVMCSMIAAILLGYGFGLFPGSYKRFRVLAFPLAILFGYTAALTLSRGGWICGIATCVGFVLFRTRLTSYAAYTAATVGFILLMMFSKTLLQGEYHLKLQAAITSDSADRQGQMSTRLSTLGSRLLSMEKTMTEERRWRPFGVLIEGVETTDFYGADSEGNPYYVHDGFSEILLKIGYIPLFSGCIFGVWFLYRFHQRMSRMNKEEKAEAVFYYAIIMGTAIGFIANSAQFRLFPVNTFFYLSIGACWSVAIVSRERQNKQKTVTSLKNHSVSEDDLSEPTPLYQ